MAKLQTGLAVVLVLTLVYVGSFIAFRAQVAEEREINQDAGFESIVMIELPDWSVDPANAIYRPLLWLDEKIANDGSRIEFVNDSMAPFLSP